MNNIDLVKDAQFLRELDKERIKTTYAKIIVLDWDENIIQSIEGRVTTGSLSISQSGNPRRSGSITIISDLNDDNDLTDINNLLSINKKIEIDIGVTNNVDSNYDDIIWFKQGIFVITQPNISHSLQNVTISLQFQDKMCLLNGTMGGGLPTSVEFDSYDQWDEEGKVESVEQKFFDIILTLVANFGHEAIENIFINDMPFEIKQGVCPSDKSVYFNPNYTLDEETGACTNAYSLTEISGWEEFKVNEECGYHLVDFTPSQTDSLTSSLGDNVCTILDKIVSGLGGNYEYFYDVDGHFIFQEIKNYLNTTYVPVQTVSSYVEENGGLTNETNYEADFSDGGESVYTFDEGSSLIASYTNAIDFTNIKNDYHIWGKTSDSLALHYHVAIKEKPQMTAENGTAYPTRKVVIVTKKDSAGNDTDTKTIRLSDSGTDFTPVDWREELFIEGLEKQQLQLRPDVYEQELLDLFDNIWDWENHKFQSENPNDLNYFIDFLDPIGLKDISIDSVGTKICTDTQSEDSIRKLVNTDIPNIIMISETKAAEEGMLKHLQDECRERNCYYSIVSDELMDNIYKEQYAITAQERARTLMYQYTVYPSAISITSIPVYYLNTNTRITVQDDASGINGDFIITSITVPFDGKSTMSISASKALVRV